MPPPVRSSMLSVPPQPLNTSLGFITPFYPPLRGCLSIQYQAARTCRSHVWRTARLPSRRLRPPSTTPSCTAASQFAKKEKKLDQDDPFHFDAALLDPPIAFSRKVARSSLQALLDYYADLCRQQPFIARRLGFAIASIITSKLISITVPLLLKRVIDLLMVSSPGQRSTAKLGPSAFPIVAMAIALYSIARLLADVANELRNTIFAKGGQRIGRSITASSFAHIHSLEAAFHTTSRTGAVTRVIDRGTRSVMVIFRGMLFNFLPTIFELMLVCGILVRNFSPIYVFVTMATFIAFVIFTLRINDTLGVVRAQMNAAENDASAKLTDSLVNVEAVKSFDNAGYELARYDDSLAVYERIAIHNEWLFAELNIGQGIIFAIGLTMNLLLAGHGVVNGTLTVGSVVMLSAMLQQLWVPLNFLGWQYRELKQSLIDLQNLFEILNRNPKIVDAPDAAELEVSGGEIVFEDVSFTYPEPDDSLLFARKPSSSPISPDEDDSELPVATRKLALDQLSFKVPAGKSLALVGSSGSGKSTATRLLYRLYDLTSGRILIDGQDISKATISSLRQAVSIVPQDTVLFNDTIAYNIRYGRPSATDEEVIAAAKAASIHDVIMRTKEGYQTLVGERGVRISGGERQRLSVARAFLKGSKIILEDESTSALDTLTEMEVSKALRNLGVNRTRIIVAHRLSTIMNADHIVVMQLGKKVEEGNFSDLLDIPNGVFRDMWERQQRKGDDVDPFLLNGSSEQNKEVIDADVNGSNVAPESESVLFEGS